ncbi:unnamed protein product [Rhizophagus irregularis]|nr:unnamed protein product [Rhizophagus irregularis]
MDLDKSEYNQSINDNSQENDSEITRLQARLSKSEEDLATLRTENERLKKVQTDYVDICKENDKLKTQLENEKNNKQTSHSEVFADDKDNYSAIQNENKVQLKQFEDKLKEKSYNQLATDIKVKNGEISEFQSKSNELEEIIQLQKKNDEYIKEINDLKNLLQRKEKEKQELIEKNINLKKEASQYQSALGSITNYRMNDNDKNHSVQLKKDIEELQYKLKNYVTTLKGDFEIDFKAVNNLMEKYNIKTKVTPKEPNKPLVKAVLQRHIIKKLTRDIRKYFKQNSENSEEDSPMHLEAEIATKAEDLENKLTDFSKTRNGTDTITQAASIKIRQEVNIALEK